MSKRSLIEVSHALEHALLEGPVNPPTVVVAAFQHASYLQREYATYARIAARGATVVMLFADGEAHDAPPGCHAVVLDPREPLAEEWNVIAVGPAAGAFLVAVDAHRVDPTDRSLEGGRRFVGRWGHSQVRAVNELARLRAALGTRPGPEVTATIDRLLTEVMPAGHAAASSIGTDGEAWATRSLHRMAERTRRGHGGGAVLRAQLLDAHAAVEARDATRTDPSSGLPTAAFLALWSARGHGTALPVGIVLVRVASLVDAGGWDDRRAVHHASRRVAAALTEPLAATDTAVHLDAGRFAVVLPGASARHLRRVVAVVVEGLELAGDGYPHVSLRADVASTVTLARPLPLDELERALDTTTAPQATPDGDAIVVLRGDRMPPDPGGLGALDPAVARPRRPRDGSAAEPLGDPAPGDQREDVHRRADRALATLSALPLRAGRGRG